MGYSLPDCMRPNTSRHVLSDGSAALLHDDHVLFAAIEERLSGKRYAGGFGSILEHMTTRSPYKSEAMDAIALSSCCGPKWEVIDDTFEELKELCWRVHWKTGKPTADRFLVVDHHESHAVGGFVSSGFDNALIAVIDGFGNLRAADGWDPREWWRGFYERHSYYSASWENGKIKLDRISSDADGFDDMGIGEAYRALTHFCGWDSYQHAGSVMALAPYGKKELINTADIITFEAGHIVINLENRHKDAGYVLEEKLMDAGCHVPVMKHRQANPNDLEYCSIIAMIQHQFAEALSTRLLKLAEDHGFDKIVITGGAAMNCLAMGEIQKRFHGDIHVPAYPSDTGQGLGNALWATYSEASPLATDRKLSVVKPSPFLGFPYLPEETLDLEILEDDPTHEVLEHSKEEQAYYAAEAVSDGKIVATCLGRSEYGPRALGNRSILADPRNPSIGHYVNDFKKREAYRPYAPAIMEEFYNQYFQEHVSSPYMSFAVYAQPSVYDIIPGVLHRDYSARVQTVSKESDSPLRAILEAFYSITGIPVLLNTSYNRKGSPMVESPQQALKLFLVSNIELLLLDKLTIISI